ncbi:unnamed protein product [Leptidea sinapis]|uniref:Uncharacterized protein n=1 Tax=Leptidea sinapis TaxID=189913 RepID=A0A5E4Q7E4_9NEOP|nr:unnamed protein product [Leptidea sinapis]
MCLHVRLLCEALWWPLLLRCARAAHNYDDDYDQVPGPAPVEDERRGSVSNWFSSLRRGGRRKRDENTAPFGYGSLGRRKDAGETRGKTRSAWDLTAVARMISYRRSI